MLFRLPKSRARRQTRLSAAAHSTVVDAPQTMTAEPTPMAWPQRPDPSVFSESIPLFFISRDNDGFWVACEADFRIGGVFLSQHSALRFARRCSEPTRCATMILEEPHNLVIENRGNRFVAQLRSIKRLVRNLASKLDSYRGATIGNVRAISARLSRAYIEDRLLRVAPKVDPYRSCCKHSDENDDDLPIVSGTETPTLAHTANDQTIVGEIRRVLPSLSPSRSSPSP